MRRFRRLFFNATSAASAIVFVAAAVSWIGSGNRWTGSSDRWALYATPERHFIWVHQGYAKEIIAPAGVYFELFGPAHTEGLIDDVMIHDDGRLASFAGFYFIGRSRFFWLLLMPYWFVLGAASILPIWWSWNFLRNRRRIARGCCSSCGYDLRSTRDRCPECGHVPSARLQA